MSSENESSFCQNLETGKGVYVAPTKRTASVSVYFDAGCTVKRSKKSLQNRAEQSCPARKNTRKSSRYGLRPLPGKFEDEDDELEDNLHF